MDRIVKMTKVNKIREAESVLVVVDMQEAFRSAIPEFASIASRMSIAVRGCAILGIPILVTEQYPQGLGSTVEELRVALPDEIEPIEKSTFSASRSGEFLSALDQTGRKQVIICGIETHVCVTQTALDLLDSGFDVFLLTDCTASRYGHDREAGIARMRFAGAVPSSMEMALFELMADSKHPKFKEVQALVK